MSPFARGLLGGIAQGVTETASMLFADEISKRKEERLAKIADRNYARDRADQLADISSQREFQQGLLKDERGYLDSVRETEAGFVTSTQIDDEGNLKGITRSGQMLDLGQLSTVDPLLTPSLRALEGAQAEASRLGISERGDNEAVWDRLQRATEQFNQAYEESRRRLGREESSDLPSQEQILRDGLKLFGTDGMGTGIDSVDFDGVTYSGSQLEDLRTRFRTNYADYYGQLYGQ